MKLFTFRIFLFVLTGTILGCATGSHIITGHVRPACDPAMVEIFLEPPAEYETIGIVEASSEVEFSSQAAQDRAIAELKNQAAKIGANGVLLTDAGQKAGEMVGIYTGGMIYAGSSEIKTAKGKAIFVLK